MAITRRDFLRLSTAALLASAAASLRAQDVKPLAAQLIRRGRTDLPHVSLTYDDCWDEAATLALAEAAAERDLSLTFFPAGLAIRANLERPTEGHEDLYRRIFDLGHEFGCHLWSHADISEMDRRTLVGWEIFPWLEALEEALGEPYTPVGIRPPFGITTDALFQAAWRYEQPIILWGGDLKDSFCAPQTCASEVLSRFEKLMKPGEIFLQHSNAAALEILDDQLSLLAEAGLTHVPLSQMLEELSSA